MTDEYIRDGMPHVLQGRIVPPYVTLLRIHGPFLFGTTEKLVEATANIDAFEPVVILRLRNMTAIDATGIHAIESFAKRLHDSGRALILCGAMEQPSKLLSGARFLERVGRGKHDAQRAGGAGSRGRAVRRAGGVGTENREQGSGIREQIREQ